MDTITAQLLADGLNLPSPHATVPVPPGTHCAMTGAALEMGHPLWEIVPSAAGEYLELLPGGTHGYVSDSVARLFAGTWNLGSRVVCACGLAAHPLISRENAAKEQRACWSDLARSLLADHVGHQAILICTTDFKKRLWPQARATSIGATTSLILYVTHAARSRRVAPPAVTQVASP